MQEADSENTTASADEDPIFALIEQHKRAYAAYSAILLEQNELETTIPLEKRKTSLDAWSDEVFETDDPRWVAYERKTRDLVVAEDDARLGLISVEPTTLQGAIALLQYVAELDTRGYAWLENLHEEGEAADEQNTTLAPHWSYYLHRNLATSLQRLAA
jgi:hypothetical protein